MQNLELIIPIGGAPYSSPCTAICIVGGFPEGAPSFFATPIREILKIILVTAGIPIISVLPGFLVGNSFRV